MLPLQILNVLNVRLIGYCEACCLEATNAKLHTIERHDLGGLLGDVIDKLRETKNSGRDFSFELCVSGENHNRLDAIGRKKIEQLLNGSNVPKILKNRVLKLKLPLEQDLSPLRVFAIGEDPALVVLGFYDEDTKP